MNAILARIGIVGKTRACKSSLCNTIFKGEECPVSDVGAYTLFFFCLFMQKQIGNTTASF
jgi:hypothetical protein